MFSIISLSWTKKEWAIFVYCYRLTVLYIFYDLRIFQKLNFSLFKPIIDLLSDFFNLFFLERITKMKYNDEDHGICSIQFDAKHQRRFWNKFLLYKLTQFIMMKYNIWHLKSLTEIVNSFHFVDVCIRLTYPQIKKKLN